MVSWILIAVVTILVIVASIKLKELKHKLTLYVVIVAAVFLIGTLGYVYFQSDADLTTYDGFVSLGKAYMVWVTGAFETSKQISGYVVEQSMNSSDKKPSAKVSETPKEASEEVIRTEIPAGNVTISENVSVSEPAEKVTNSSVTP